MLDTIQTTASPRDALAVLAAYHRVFAQADFAFGEDTEANGETGFAYAAEPTQFVMDAYEFGVVQDPFDWAGWIGTAEAQSLLEDPQALAQADQDDLFCLITACLRQDRLLPGTMNQWFEEGLLVRILERASVLLAELPLQEG